MFKFLKLPLLIALLHMGLLSAHAPPCPGSWNLSASYLYYLPSIDDTYFVIDQPQTSINPIGTRENNDFCFHSGFRVEGAYRFGDGNRLLRGSYTRLNAQQSRTVSGNFLSTTLGSGIFPAVFRNFSGFASADNEILYQRADGLFDQQLWCCYGMNLTLLAGVEYAYVRLLEEYIYQFAATQGVINQRSKAWGIGPQLGLGLDYSLCQFSWCCPGTLMLRSSALASTLASRTESETINVITGQQVLLNISDEPTWKLIPAFHARVGLNYVTCFSLLSTSLEIGYEFSSYFRSVTRALSTVGSPNRIATKYFNFSMQGLYVEANISF